MAANELMVYREQPMESGYVTAEVYLSPLPDTEPVRVKVRIGSLVRDILPTEARSPMICVIDGVPIKREWWLQRPVCEGDRIQFYPIFLGGKGSRSVLGIIAMIAVATFANWAAEAFVNAGGATWGAGLIRAGIMLLGSALISAILPPVSGGNASEGDKASSVYNVDTAGNQAKVFSPIPVQYGRMKYYPNYASQPYGRYFTETPTLDIYSGGGGSTGGGSSSSGHYEQTSENGYTFISATSTGGAVCLSPDGLEIIYSAEAVKDGTCPCYKWVADRGVRDVKNSARCEVISERGYTFISATSTGGAVCLSPDGPEIIYSKESVYNGSCPCYRCYGDDPDVPETGETSASPDGDQYYYALFCLGQGTYEIEQELIADAPIDSFSDVLVHRVLQPGEKPLYVNPCVVTNEAVSGQSLDKGDWIGPFPVCGPSRKVKRVELDFVFPQGLCKLDDQGKAQSATVVIKAHGRAINNNGEPASGWFEMGDIVITASSLTPQRRTLSVDLNINGVPSAFRIEVRVCRSGVKDSDDMKDHSSVQWTGLKGFIDEPAPLCPTATHYELVMRASDQLSSLSQRKISIIATRKVSSWDDSTPTPTRSPARALWDKWTNPVYGDGLPRERIDIDMLRHYDALCAEREDMFDYVFENRVSSQEADQLIAKTMRCVALQRQGVKTIVRDELCDMPLTLFNPTNTAEKSVSLEYIQITEETTDGVIAEYFSSVKWDWEEVECPGPGRTYSNTGHPRYNPSLPVMQNPARITMNGITRRKHAEREGLYYAYTNALRRQFITWTTELQGALVYYGAPVLMATTLYNMQQGGEIRDYDESDGTIELTNGVRQGKIVLMRPNGTLTEPMDFDVVDEEHAKIRLRSDPGFTINYGDYKTERTKYVILEGDMIRRIVKVTGITPKGISESGAPMYELRGVVDVPEVHTIDNFLLYPDPPDLPPWVEPDPGPDTPVPQPESQVYVKLREIGLMPYLMTYEALYPNSGYPASIQFYRDGAVRTHYYDRSSDANPVTRGAIPGQEQPWNHWIEPNPPIQGVGANYEIMFIGYWGRNYYINYGPGNDPSEEFLNNPERWYMQGHKLQFIKDFAASIPGMEESTASALVEANQRYQDWATDDGVKNNTLCYTDWISLDKDPELKGFWDTRPYPYPTQTSIYPDDNKTMMFAVAIRDKSNHIVQSVQTYRMGIYRLKVDNAN